MKVYIAGPMRNIPEFNFPAFNEAAERLRKIGHEVFSPAEADIIATKGHDFSSEYPTGDEKALAAADYGFTIRDALWRDMDYIIHHAEAIYMLPGWESSKGATAERALAQAIGLEEFYAEI